MMEGTKEANPAAPSKPQEAAPKMEEKTPVVQDNTAVPDPDEDDLDDLDDMLDDFSNTRIDPKVDPKTTASRVPGAEKPSGAPAAATTSGVPSGDGETAPGLDDFGDEDFQKQLQAGMAELMSEMEKAPEMQAQFENLFKGLETQASEGVDPTMAAATAAATAGAAASGASKPAPGAERPKSSGEGVDDFGAGGSFQETIRRTMERMQNSGDQATAAASAADGSEDDFIAEMMRAMKDMPGAGGDGNEEDFTKMLMGMMEQLTNKEILYEPMRELNEKFPGWMEAHRAGLSEDDARRYTEQQKLVSEMVTKFEEPTYTDSNAADREYIVDRMQKMQAAGSPPPDLVGDMPSAKEVLDGPDDSCPTQ